MIQLSVPNKWLTAKTFGTRKGLILLWLVAGSIISYSYKSILLSTLIGITYEKPIETLAELDAAKLPLMMPANTAPFTLVETDPREVVKRIFSRSVDHAFPISIRSTPKIVSK